MRGVGARDLGWEAPRDIAPGLALDPRAYGELLHDLLRRTVQGLAGGAGFAHVSADDVARAAVAAARVVERDWPLREATPPPLLWRHTLDLATAEACAALKLAVGEGTQSWAEIGFGRGVDDGAAGLPWRPNAAVVLDKSNLKVTGFIDRLDHRPKGDCRVTDYKTGAVPPHAEVTILGGEELQRVLYTLVVRQLLPDTAHVTAVLLYLRGEQNRRAIEDMDPTAFVGAVAVAADLLRSGRSIAGVDAFTRFNEYAIALPAASEGYQARKSPALGVERSREYLERRMSELTDAPVRARALSDHGATLLVEAAAGIGKTALIAGRIAMMLAAGVGLSC